MRLFALVVAGAVLGAIPSLAEEPPTSAGRYQIAPDKDGFVRLDTETGAMSHCVKKESAWRCEVLAEDQSTADARVRELVRQVEVLNKKVDDLAARVTTLEARRTGEPPTSSAPSNDPELDRALSFAERLMQRFFDMVRQLKTEDSGQPI